MEEILAIPTLVFTPLPLSRPPLQTLDVRHPVSVWERLRNGAQLATVRARPGSKEGSRCEGHGWAIEAKVFEFLSRQRFVENRLSAKDHAGYC